MLKIIKRTVIDDGHTLTHYFIKMDGIWHVVEKFVGNHDMIIERYKTTTDISGFLNDPWDEGKLHLEENCQLSDIPESLILKMPPMVIAKLRLKALDKSV